MRLILTLCLLSFALLLNAADGPIVSLFGRVQLRGSVQLMFAEVSSLTNDMIACWPLDEATGTREDDWATFDLTDNNTVTGTTGPVGLGDASSFATANSEYLSHADHASLRMGDFDTTFAVWANLTSIGAGQILAILSKDNSTVDDGYVLAYSQTDSKFKWLVNKAVGDEEAESSATYAPGSGWHFIVCGYDSTNDRIFLSVDNGASVTASMSGPPRAGTAEFRIGDRVAPASFWNGAIAGAVMWGRLLTAGEITTLWAGGNGSRACEEPGN